MSQQETQSPLQTILAHFRNTAKTEREKGTYFEELIFAYLRHEATYKDLYSDIWTYAQWAKLHGKDGQDIGIDLVAKTRGTAEYHAIQCKFYAEDYRIQKGDIDSFLAASGQKPFSHRLIVATTDDWGEKAEKMLAGQHIPVNIIDLHDLENSQIDWAQYHISKDWIVIKPRNKLRPHQQDALQAVTEGFKTADRGKMIMACGTGKTFVSLKIAEQIAGKGKRVLFLVPSLNLLSQTLTEWTQQSRTQLHSFAVCSDAHVGKKRRREDDKVETFIHELRYPATTEGTKLFAEMATRHDDQHMSVVFSTYHSIQVIADAQRAGLPEFDLVICDEAHRTTGETFAGEDESAFVKVHDNAVINAKKRLYMTATPKIYGDSDKKKEEQGGLELCSMDDEEKYGKDLYVLSFSRAVQQGLLTDYKVIVLAVDEDHISDSLQNLLKDANNSLKVSDAAKIVGCWKALAKLDIKEDIGQDTAPMQRAVAFCQKIDPSEPGKPHKVSSKQIAGVFAAVVGEYQRKAESEGIEHGTLKCEAEHVDGSMNATEKEGKINWLKQQPDVDTCKILSNVRCLSEGVDVPALDAVLFLTPRNSQVEVVQSVGRVMRKSLGKNKGYVVLPVVIPSDKTPEEALNDNKTYKVVWEILQALRSHDDEFDAMINKMELMETLPDKMEVIAVSGFARPKAKRETKAERARKSRTIGVEETTPQPRSQQEIGYEIGDIERAIYAKIVKKCGNRRYWDEWASDIATIAQTHISRITAIVENPDNSKENQAFAAFAKELRNGLNDAITDSEVIEMLAQHLITKPVFDALFQDYSFASHNPVSQAMQKMLDILHEHHLEKERDTLERFYASVRLRAAGIDNAAGKQKIVIELYDKFFRNAFPKMTERLGIVYTPVEVVDFIIHSVNHLLKQEFGQTLGSKDVHIIDPFTGTGTFITRLLQSGLIKSDELEHKYKHEIHANEIVLLAYYIAAINIEAAYHDLAGGDYAPFKGICLTDTFQMYEEGEPIGAHFAANNERRERQKKLGIQVVLGNPPYSAGQGSQNDDAANVEYKGLDARIAETYIAKSLGKGGKRSSYDSYIRAIRWASDRLGDRGIVGFVTNSGFLESVSADGLRKCLVEEFASLYIMNLRGDIRRNMASKGMAKEGQNIFGSATMAGIAISFLVKSRTDNSTGKIFYHDIGDDLTTEAKKQNLTELVGLSGISQRNAWLPITPDKHGDWLNQRDESFAKHMLIGTKKNSSGEKVLFRSFSNGVVTSRDWWVYNASKSTLAQHCKGMIDFYNSEIERYADYCATVADQKVRVQDFVEKNEKKISWGGGNWQARFAKLEEENFEAALVSKSLYRPYEKRWHYGGRAFNHSFYSMDSIFPEDDRIENLAIQTNSNWKGVGQIALISDVILDVHCNGDSQCFPLYLYEKTAANAGNTASQSPLLSPNNRASEPASQRASEPASQRASEPASQRAYIV